MCRSIINAIEESDDDVCRRRDGIMAMKLKKGRSMDPHTRIPNKLRVPLIFISYICYNTILPPCGSQLFNLGIIILLLFYIHETKLISKIEKKKKPTQLD
jgi:hypothetical protein